MLAWEWEWGKGWTAKGNEKKSGDVEMGGTLIVGHFLRCAHLSKLTRLCALNTASCTHQIHTTYFKLFLRNSNMPFLN